jgi:hypothetical protein
VTTVLRVGNSEGSRRCDAKCHEAKSAECDCVCGGRYHGRGTAYALAFVEWDARAGVFGEEVRVVAALRVVAAQLSLIEEEATS